MESWQNTQKNCPQSRLATRGFVLQDIVNELGRRLGFNVENGRYQGTSAHIGYDGIWKAPNGYTCVVEVKTSDVYSINLDTVAGYRADLMRLGRVGSKSSTLLLVSNADTGGLEAQVRGSRHAWDMRLISVRALADLVRLYEASNSLQTGTRIRTLLTPLEFTRLDGLADILLQTAEETADAREQNLIASNNEIETDPYALDDEAVQSAESQPKINNGTWQVTISVILSAKRKRIVETVEFQKDLRLAKRTRATYSSEDRHVRLACTISKLYATPKYTYPYWFAFQPNWRNFLAGGEGYLALGFVDLNKAAVIPASFIEGLLPKLNTTTQDDGETYWHIHLVRTESDGLAIRLKDAPPADLKPFMVDLKTSGVQ